MNKQKTILITGGTGALGEYVIRHFLKQDNVNLILLIRAKSDTLARERLQKTLGFSISDDVEVFAADLEKDNLGLSEHDYTSIAQKVTHILHAAASTRFNLPIEDARERNVETTKKMLIFAESCPQLERFGYVSSALVAGKRSGTVLEDEFEHNEGFINTYEESKYEAEKIVRSYTNQLPIVIFRPPLVVSKPHADYKGPVNLLSHSLALIKKGFLPIVPGTKDSVFDVVDGTATAQAILDLFLKEKLQYLTYHISNGTQAITSGKMLELLEEYLGQRVPITFGGDMKTFRRKLLWILIRKPWLYPVYKKTASYLPEVAYPKTFDNTHLFEELNITHFGPPPEDVFRSILS